MRRLDILILAGLFCLLIFFSYLFLSSLFPGEVKSVSSYSNTAPELDLPMSSSQFYPHMRFPTKEITFWIEDACNLQKKEQINEAFLILSEETLLEFSYSEKRPQIRVYCSAQAPQADEGNSQYYVAGEGGPTSVINISNKFIILEGKVSLFRPEKCEKPNLALHEILHVLGFDHNQNQQSIMYPVTSCSQELDNEIVEEIDALYSLPSAPDVMIEQVKVNTTSRHLSFSATVSNYGYAPAQNVTLRVISEGEEIYSAKLGEISLGTKKIFTLQNMRIWSDIDSLTFMAESSEDQDLDNSNNRAVVVLKRVS